MKETYTRKEVVELLVNQGKRDYERYRKQLDENCRIFVKLMHESIDLAWQYIDEAQESNSCS